MQQKKHYHLSKHSLSLVCLRDIHKGNVLLEHVKKEQIQLLKKLKNMG